MIRPPVILKGEGMRMKEAAFETGLSESTLRRWNRQHVIGRQSKPNAPIEFSYPALVMLQHDDREALEQLRSGDRESELVRLYLDRCGVRPNRGA